MTVKNRATSSRDHRPPQRQVRPTPTPRPERSTMTIVNLTPHPIRLYGWDVPDRFNLGDHEPQTVLDPSGTVARLGEIELGPAYLRNCDARVEYVEFRHANGLPDADRIGDSYDTWYVVSLALALGSDRGDLLVPYREIRNHEGTVIGCRALARVA